LSGFARSGQSFVEYFETYAKTQLHVSLGEKFFERALEDGQAIVCLDGLDEVSQPAQRIEVRNAITALSARYPRNRFIITSRVAGYDSASLDKRAFAHHTVVPFGEKEIQSFVEKWYAAQERESEQAKTRAANLFNDLKANERLLKLAENPLMLTIIALVHRIEAELPNERVKLYDKCTEALLSTWEGVKGLPLSERERERPYYKNRRRLLERLALWMHTLSQDAERQAEIKRGDLKSKLIDFLLEDPKLDLSRDLAELEAEAFIELAKSRTGILVERGDGIYSFVHLTFQEYFAACDLEKRYVTDLERLWREIQPHLYDPRWREVILLLLGRLNEHDEPPSILAERILHEHDKFDEVLHRNLFLAAACLADRVNVRETLCNEIVNILLKFAGAKRPKYYSLRDDSIRALGNLHSNALAGERLLAFAQDANVDAFARVAAAQALGELGQVEDAVELLLALVQDRKIALGVRSNAAKALGQLGRTDEVVIRALFLLVQGKVHPILSHAVRQALRQLGRTDNAVTQGLWVLAQDEQVGPYARRTAAQLLGELGHTEEAVRVLLALAQDKKVEVSVRSNAAQALGELGHTEEAVRVLLALAQDKKVEVSVRSNAAQALGELGHTEEAVRVLLALAQDKQVSPYARRNVAQALGEQGCTEDAGRLLLVLAQDVKIEAVVRSTAAQALGELGHTEDAVRVLSALAQDEKVEARVRSNAAQALGGLGRTDDAVIQDLLALVQDEKVDGSVRSAAAQALGELGRTDDAVIQSLMVLAQDADANEFARSAAAQALGELGHTEDAVRVLLALAQDAQVGAYVRSAAAQALGHLGQKNPRVALGLLKLPKDRHVADAAYDALKQVVGNLRYAELDNGQKRIKRTGRKKVGRKQKAAGSKRKTATKNRKSEIIDPKSEMEHNESTQP
jgi:HEAT repeat protein